MSDGPKTAIELRMPAWRKALPNVEDICRAAVGAAFAAADLAPGEVSIVLADDAFIRTLNRDHRGRDRPTDVLAFPQSDANDAVPLEQPRLWGDVVIAYETMAADAEQSGVPLEAHVAHLIVHGVLHLAGYDHQDEPAAEAMEELEARALARLGVPDPYAAPAAIPATAAS